MLKKRIIKGIILILISFAVYLGNSLSYGAEKENVETYKKVGTSGSGYNGGTSLQYVNYFNYELDDQEYMFFCNKLGYPPILINRAYGSEWSQGSPDISVSDGYYKEDRINPQIAYALSIGVLPANLGGDATAWEYLQNLIWDAKIDEGGNDGILSPDSWYNSDLPALTPIEVQRYRLVQEQIFEPTIGNGQPVFKIEDKQASLFVDQNDGTYIYGPFELKINTDYAKNVTQEAIDNLIREIMQQGHEEYIDYDDDFDKSEAYIENYFRFHKSIQDNFEINGITDSSKKLLKYDIAGSEDHDNYSVIIVDKNEKPIDFPQISKGDSGDKNNFFIKFYPARGGSIINLGDPTKGAKLFELKIKWGTYVKYKEHIQQSQFYTKGVTALIQHFDLDNNLLIPEGRILKVYSGDDVRVQWVRIPGVSDDKPVRWWSYLQEIRQPRDLVLYNNSAGNFVKVNGNVASIDRDELESESNYYALNNYYEDIKCTGFSTCNAGQVVTGAKVRIPFDFAGSSDYEIMEATETVKHNYGFPITQKMEFVQFYGMVKETATQKASASRKKKKKQDAKYNPDTGLYDPQPDKWEDDGTWTSSKTVTRYRYVTLNENDIATYAAQGKIKPETTCSHSSSDNPVDGISEPEDSSDTEYSGFTSWIDGQWTIQEIYGANTNAQVDDDYINAYGFKYKTENKGWYLDTDFETYDARLELSEAFGLQHEFVFVPGPSTHEYDVWIPLDMATAYADNPTDAERLAKLNAEIQNMKQQMQSFVSFETEGDSSDIFKFGERQVTESAALPYLKIAEAFGGNVWKDSVNVKGILERGMDGLYDLKGEDAYRGVKVDLYECDINYKPPQRGLQIGVDDVERNNARYLTSTFTDSKGNYRFYGHYSDDSNKPLINPLKKYYVKFVYNGQIYAQTLYNVEIDSEKYEDEGVKYGHYADYTSKGIDEKRTEFNKRFENIYADSNNYTYSGERYKGYSGETSHTGRAYGMKHAVKEALDGVANDPSADPLLDTFEEQYNLFVHNNTHADFIDGTEDYEFSHAGGTDLEKPIENISGEIVASRIDDAWEYPVETLIDFNYDGLSPSVKQYLQDCMIEASVPYTPNQDIYGKNLSKTDLHKTFPEESTFNLKDMNRVCMGPYSRWVLKKKTIRVKLDAQVSDNVQIPGAISAYVDQSFGEGSVVTIYTYEGKTYVSVEKVDKTTGSVSRKVASIGDKHSVDFTDLTTKVAAEINNSHPRPQPEEGPTEPGTPTTPTMEVVVLYWDEEVYDEVHVVDHFYEPEGETYINLYNKKFDLRHCWSFGVYEREYSELRLDKDLYKATMVVNGKKEVYSYAKKVSNRDAGPYNIVQKEHIINLNRPLNGNPTNDNNAYTREIRKSDYLYDEDIAYGNGKYSKNIQAYLTYKIQITNEGSYTVRLNEIADYYDSDNLEFDGVRDANGNLVVQNGKYQIETHTENIDGQINKSKYTYASNMLDRAGHDPSKEYIGIYNYSAYANSTDPNKVQESFRIENHDADNDGQPYHLNTIYIRGNDPTNGNYANEAGPIGIPVVSVKDGQEIITNKLVPGQVATLFVTFKVKNNSIDNRITRFANQIKLDQITQDFADKLPTIGKNNFAEVNSYATYYTSEMPADVGDGIEKTYYRPYGEGRIQYGEGTAVYLDKDGKVATGIDPNPETNPDICVAGVVDVFSNPGSFTERDVEVIYREAEDGEKFKDLQFKDQSFRKITRDKGENYPRMDMHTAEGKDEESLPNIEPDMDKAPTIRLILDNDEIRKISGCVFDDNRTVNSDGSPIGNGENGGDDTPVNGVTVQLVELIQDVDYDGTFTGQYIGEKVWDECTYTGLYTGDYQLKDYAEGEEDLSGKNYYSGIGLVKYILNSTDDMKEIHTSDKQIKELMSLEVDDGKYCFAGLPSGDFIVRFLYGDTERTVLTKTELSKEKDNDNENNKAIRETEAVNTLVKKEGLNAKSYNGQDYKSTVYQRKLNNDSSMNYQVNQDDISYKMKEHQEVEGYTRPIEQDYKTTQEYDDGVLRTKDELYRNDVIYYDQPINNISKDSKTSDNDLTSSPRSDINNVYKSMWRYDRVAVEGKQGSTNNKLSLSDANDLYGYRQRGIDYAKGYAVNQETESSDSDRTLLNYRAEVLSSFERVTSQEVSAGQNNWLHNAIAQNDMIDELIENTYMVAQSGIISMNHEYEGINDNDANILNGNEDNLTDLHMVSGDQPNHVNHAEGIDLGLVERPRSQVKLTKNVANLEIKLADGQTLFNANTSMKNLKYKDHEEHKIDYKEENVGPILEYVRVKLHTQTNPELIQAEIDDEIMNGATINATYHLQVENVGEIDYQDRYFYYYGKKLDDTEPVRTRVVRVVDYVPNDVSYDASKQNDDAHWDVYNGKDLIVSGIRENSNDNSATINIASNQSFKNENAITNNGYIIPIPNGAENPGSEFYDKVNRDYVTRTFSEEVRTYNTIVVTKDLDNRLLPTLYTQQNESAEGQNIDKTTLILTTSITSSGNSEDLTYNNLAEVIETANPYGRRMQYSISGNQEMANQDINDGGGDRSTQDHHAYSSSKITQPKEIDADSAQEIQILPPTGSPEYRNRVLAIITTAIATIIVLVGAIIIKKKVYEK